MTRAVGMSAVKLALLAQQKRARENSSTVGAEPLAIVGMGCRFPGGASTPAAFWSLLRDGTDAVCEVPGDRWDWKEYYDANPSARGKMTTRWGGFLREPVDGLDSAFFGISPREAVHLDPQQRLFLEVAYETLDDAGLRRESLVGSHTGVFVASYHNDYGQAQYADLNAIDAYTTTGTSHSILANRLSYLLDLRGPSISIDTACSSSLVAVHLACDSLRAGDCDLALAGGVSLMLTPEMTVALSKWGFLAEDGRCKTFDERANGFVRGEGCGIVAIRRLSDALADGERVYAVIRGSAVNQDGRTNVLTAPSGLAQRAVVRSALEVAGVLPSQISCIEAHGTGTAIGDPIEVEALADVLGPRTDGDRCVLGSAKTNIGHLEAAAGIAGVIKVALALTHDAIPPHLHFKRANPLIDLARSPFSVPTSLIPWPRTQSPRVAGVSSFGFGGTNAHVVLEEAPAMPAPVVPSTPTRRAELLPISAHSPNALRALAESYRDLLNAPGASAADVCHAAALKRDELEHRVALVGATAGALREQLEGFLRNEVLLTGAVGQRATGARPRVAFVFSGQGPQWWGMGRELRDVEPVFAEALAACDHALLPHTGWSVLAELSRDEATSRLQETEVAQPALFAIQVALAALWRSWGVLPDTVVGHSVGEIAAAYVAGALTLADAARLASLRGQIMQDATGLEGKMAQVDLPEKEALELAAASGGKIALAAINGPRTCVLSGDAAELLRTLATLTEQGIGHRLLPVNYAFHSQQMAPFQVRLVNALSGLAPVAPTTRMISTVTGQEVVGPLDANYWGRNVREPVRLAHAIALLAAEDVDTFVELAPHPVLRVAIEETLDAAGMQATVVGSLRRGVSEATTTRVAAATLWANGIALNWNAIAPAVGRHVDLPTYPWQRIRYWQSPSTERTSGQADASVRHPFLGPRVTSPALAGSLHTARIGCDAPAYLGDHRIGGEAVFPATGYIELALAALGLPDGAPAALFEMEFNDALILREGRSYALQLATRPSKNGFEFDVHGGSLDDGGVVETWSTHARGRAESASRASNEAVSLEAVRARCGSEVEVTSFYSSLHERGLSFGPAFRGLRRLRCGDGEALGEITLQEAAGGSGGPLRAHPALLDSCLQVCLAVLYGNPDSNGDDPGPVYVPIGVDALFMQGRLGDAVWSHAVVRRAADATVRVDITVFDEIGAPVIRLEGLRLTALPASRIAALAGKDAQLYRTEWVSAAPTPQQSIPQGRWLVLADRLGIGAATAAMLRARGAKVTVVHTDGDATRDSAALSADVGDASAVAATIGRAAKAPLAGIVGCWALDWHDDQTLAGAAQASAQVTTSVLHMLQAMVALPEAAPLWLVTRGAHATGGEFPRVNAAQAAAVGIARTVDLEHPELAIVRVDLEPASGTVEELAGALVDEILYGVGEEREIARRGAVRLVPRLTRLTREAATSSRMSSRLEPSASGLLEELAIRSHPRHAPGANELEIEVEASGLNFRDVLSALAMYPGQAGPLGSECAGIVRRIGHGVSGFAEGDRVMAFAPGSLAAHVVVAASWVTRFPEGLTSTQAATLPVGFLTGQLGLLELARLQPGERVLIHAGSGGVGMAAIQLAQARGAEVFATAGTPQKRALLTQLGVTNVLDSRSTAFVEAVREATSGSGVHVVLNSLAGEFIPASLSVLAAGGRFLEMGKRDIWTGAQVARVRPDVTYMPFDLGESARADATLIPRLFEQLHAGLADGTLRALPVVAHRVADASAAFRTMAQAKHVGKLAITFPIGGHSTPRADASYLVTGGLGALGLAAAQWLAMRGAKHIVLASRRTPNRAAQAAINALRADGVTVMEVAADVTRAADVDALLAAIDANGFGLAGVIHAAGIVDDGALLQQSAQRAKAVLAPKVGGAALLLERLRAHPLDFFVCYSSVAASLGSPGQTTYAAANAGLDALCVTARHSGVPAVSVQFGAWADGGMIAALGARESGRIASRGLIPMRSREALSGLEAALDAGFANVTVMAMDWTRHSESLPTGVWRTMYTNVHASRGPTRTVAGPLSLSDAPSDGMRARLEAAAPTQRERILVKHVCEQALRCLGLDGTTPVDEARALKDLGLDSLMAVELRNALARSLSITLPATLAFDFPTPAAMAGTLLQRLFPASRNATPSAPDTTERGESLAAVAALSDVEAEAMLLKELTLR